MSKRTKVDPGHGGARPNSGPAPQLAVQVKDARKLAERLQGAIRLGLQPIAERYPDLVARAIDVAMDPVNKDSAKMLTFLIELLPRMVKLEDDEKDKWAGLVKSIMLEVATDSGRTYKRVSASFGRTVGEGVPGTVVLDAEPS